MTQGAGERDRAHRRRAVIFILLATLLWSIPALAIKYLTRYWDLPTQNFVRFVSASAFLWAVCLIRARREVLSSAGELIRVLPAFAACFLYQYIYTRAFYMRDLLPGLAYMLIKSTVFFTAVFSCILFADERAVMKDRRFLAGAVLSVAGLAAFIVIGASASHPGSASDATLIVGILLVVLSAVFWSLYTVLIKLLVRRGSPLVTYTYVCTLMTAAFTVLAFAEGRPSAVIPRDVTGVQVLVVAVVSGALCVGAAHVLYYYAIRTLGTTVCGTVSLSNTFIPAVASVFLFGEQFTIWHIASGVLLVAGAAFTLQSQVREEPPTEG